MRAPVRLLLLAAIPVAVLCACILLTVDGGGLRRTALGSWLHEARRGELLRAAGSDLMRSNESVQSILAALVDGRLTLPEAAERIRSERENRHHPFRLQPTLQPGESIEDFYLRFTVELVQWHLEGQQCQREVVQRLQRELQNYLANQPEYPVPDPESNDPAPAQRGRSDQFATD